MKSSRSKLPTSDIDSAVLHWFNQVNKPATPQSLVDALQSRFTKPTVQKSLEGLSASGLITYKDFKKTRIYFPQVSGRQVVDHHLVVTQPCSLQVLVDSILAVSNTLDAARGKVSNVSGIPSFDVLMGNSARLNGEIQAASARLAGLSLTNQTFGNHSAHGLAAHLSRHLHLWRNRRQLALGLLQSLEIEELCVVPDISEQSLEVCQIVLRQVGLAEHARGVH